MKEDLAVMEARAWTDSLQLFCSSQSKVEFTGSTFDHGRASWYPLFHTHCGLQVFSALSPGPYQNTPSILFLSSMHLGPCWQCSSDNRWLICSSSCGHVLGGEAAQPPQCVPHARVVSSGKGCHSVSFTSDCFSRFLPPAPGKQVASIFLGYENRICKCTCSRSKA